MLLLSKKVFVLICQYDIYEKVLNMVKQTITVKNAEGLHLRPAAVFAAWRKSDKCVFSCIQGAVPAPCS